MAETLAERIAFKFSTRKVRECVRSLGKDEWRLSDTEAHRTQPYPMGFYVDDANLYWAIGWGTHWSMWPWERWLVLRAFRAALNEARTEIDWRIEEQSS